MMAKGPIVRRAVTGCLERVFDELQLLLLEQGLVARRGIDQQDLLLACCLGAELVDDGVVVEGGAHTQELLEEIAFECFKRGATPTVVVSSDRYAERVYREIPKQNFSIVPKQYVGLMKAADTLIFVEDFEDPSIGAKFPRDKLQARQKAMVPIYDIIYDTKDGKKWLYAGWATAKAAKSYGIPVSELEKNT